MVRQAVSADERYDLVIRNGTIVDGTGAPPFQGDVAIRGDRIAQVGPKLGRAVSEIDAAGMLVTPGFIDIHTHYDGQATWDSILAPSSHHGVTSIAVGNCGVGFAPVKPDKHDWLINVLEGVEDIPGTALAEGLPWDWETFPEYLDALDRRRFVMDVGAYIPHAPLRAFVMGDRGGDADALPSAAEMAEMARLVVEAIEAGAVGFSTSRTLIHRSRAGDIIGTYRASENELLTIAQGMKKVGRGGFQLISDAYHMADEAFFDAEFQLVEKIMRASGRPLSITVMQPPSLPDRWREMYDKIADLRAQGLDIRAQVAARAVGAILGLRASINPFSFTPGWAELAQLPFKKLVDSLCEPEIRQRLLREVEQPSDHPFARSVVGAYASMYRLSDPVDYEPDPAHSIAAEAAAAGVSPSEYVYDVLLEEGGNRLLYKPSINYASGNLDVVHEMMSAEFALFALSDGGAHCGAICDASFPTAALTIWGKGNKSGLSFPIETVIHGYTQRNARQMGWNDRGVLAPNGLADINIIDFEALELPPPRPVYDLPTGSMRLLQGARGYRYTIKRGKVTLQNGMVTGELPGRLIRTGHADRQLAA